MELSCDSLCSMQPEDSQSTDLEQRLEELGAQVEQLQKERDKAINARDILVRDMLVRSTPARQESTSGRRLGLIVLVMLTLGAVAMVLIQTSKLRRIAQQPMSLPGKIVRTRAMRGQPVAYAHLTQIPVLGLSLAGRSALSPRGDQLAVGGMDGRIAIYQLERGRQSRLLRAHSGQVRDVAFTRDGRHLISGGADGAVYSWDIQRRKKARTLRSQGSGVRRLAVSATHVAVAAEQPGVELYPLAEGGQLRMLKGHTDWVRAVAFSRSGKELASGGHDRVIKIWSVDSGTQIRELSGHRLWIGALAFSPDGGMLASAGFEKRVRIWNLNDGSVSHELAGHVRRVEDLAFDARGRRLATASLDRTALIWNVRQGSVSDHLVGHRYQVSSVAFHPSGRLAVTTSTDGTLRLWPLPLKVPQVMAQLPAPGEGMLTLRHNTTGQRLVVQVLDSKGNVLDRGLDQLAQLMRSGPDDRARRPDPSLVKLLYRVADHFGRRHEVVIVSGYRSPEYNELRTQQSRQVGKESLHMQGQAIDFRIQEVTITSLHRYVKKLRVGGVGFYADSQFVHIDTGPVRYWEGN